MALTDPSDWPGSMPDLRTIDNLLRCSICFEYLNVAMIIPSCSHNYCSLCIRRYMKYKRQCPSCNIEVSASELCNNRTLDELVKTFVAVRPYILKMCKKTEAGEKGSCSASNEDKTTLTQRADTAQIQSLKTSSSTLAGLFTAVKPSKSAPVSTAEPGLSPARSDESIKSNDKITSPKMKTPLRSGHSTSKRLNDGDSESLSPDNVIEIDGDFETEPPFASTSGSPALGQATPSRRQATPSSSHATPSCSHATPSCSQATPSGSQTTPSGSQTTPGGSRDKAVCPVCGVPVPTKYINTHLDACLKRSEQPETNKRAPKRKRIPAMVWKLVPDKEIKRKMRDYNLSTKGKRHELVKRLEEFILMYNAQCDAANPKSAEEISREVERIEQLKTQPQQLKEARVHRLKIEKGDTADQIQRSQQEYLSAHKNQFSKLVAEAQVRMMATKTKSQRQTDCSPSRTDSTQDSTSAEASGSSQDNVNTQASAAVAQSSAVLELDDVVILEDGDEDRVGGNVERRVEGEPTETTAGGGLDGTRILFSDGSWEASGSSPECKDLGIDTSESRLNMKHDSEVVISEPTNETTSNVRSSEGHLDSEKAVHNETTEDLMAGFSGSTVQDLDCEVLAPSSPSVASKDGHEDNQSQKVKGTQNDSEKSSLRSDPVPDSQDPLCIPESPLSAVAETRRRKRKKQDGGSNTSDSGSSFGDGETMLRRSKRERKTIK